MTNEKILVVEDDKQIRNFITYSLEGEGFSFLEAANGGEALSLIKKEKVALVLLDLGLPDMDGIEVLHQIRSNNDVPIIIVSARDQDKEKAATLDDGADDYLTKPFSATELMARIRVALRHAKRNKKEAVDSIALNGAIKMDFENHLVYFNKEEIHLSPLEYNLLKLFLSNSGKVLTYHFILKEIWGSGYGNDTQVLRALMAGVRRKIEKNPAKPEYIITEIGVGYRMKEIEVV